MRRRDFISLVGGAVAAWPLAARAQQGAMPVIGFVGPHSAEPNASELVGFRQGLNTVGYIEGQNVSIEYRWANGQYDRLPELVTDLIRREVAVIVASTAAAQPAKAATNTIPIVFATAGDPVAEGLVESLNRPGGNSTGFSLFYGTLDAKRAELIRELVPSAKIVAMLVNPTNPSIIASTRDAAAAVNSLGQELRILNASAESEFEIAFEAMARLRADVLLVGADPFYYRMRDKLVELAARHAIPAIYTVREYALAGGLISYAASLKDIFRQVGIYAGRIPKGAKPADLPVQQPTKLELVINLKTAKALGLDVPPSLLVRADEVIE
jgi:putative ABC transport system substrate-binding protein